MLDFEKELDPSLTIRDTSTLGARITRFLRKGDQAGLTVAGIGIAGFFFPQALELSVIAAGIVAYSSLVAQKKSGLPMQVPLSANQHDPKEINLGTKKPENGKGILFIGNDMKTNEEVWLTDTQARTHMMFLGTTGSGKAQPLDAKILTPGGWVTMGEIAPGDVVCTPDGGTAKVLEVYPQKTTKDIYRIRFYDGSSTEACAEHLWLSVIDEGFEDIWQTFELIEVKKRGGKVRIPRIVNDEMVLCAVESIEFSRHDAAKCIYIDHPQHLYITDDYIVTHNTEFLLSVVFNSLIHGSGFIYVDGKADNSLYGKIYSMARFMGREDDVLLINFQTGAKDIYNSTPKKMSNTLNPFAVGSSGMLSQLVVGLMSGGGEGGKSDVWENRAISFVEGLLKPLVYLRDYYGLLLDVEVIRNYFNLEPLAELLYSNMHKTDSEFGAKEWKERPDAKYPGIGQTLSGLAAYIDNLPGWKDNVPVAKQESVVSEQHGYITMQLIRTFNSLADTYGYIMKTPLAEIDFFDVFVNRRILVVLLPALEKSPPELTNLGRIVVASIKSTMAAGLGADVEGDWSKVIDAKPTTSPSPYACVLDEYGYYAVEGFAVVPAQARSLGFSAIFAGQDLPAFEKASKPEAESTLANTTTKFCGKLECTKTYEYFKSASGEGIYTKAGGFQNQSGTFISQNYMDTQSAQFEKMARVAMDDLKGQISGEWHMFYGKRIIRINSFFSNPPRVKKLRTNHFIPIAPPSNEHNQRVKFTISTFADVLFGKQLSIDEPEILQTPTAIMEEGSDAPAATRQRHGMDWLHAFVMANINREQQEINSSVKNSRSLEDIFFDDCCEVSSDEDPLENLTTRSEIVDFSGIDNMEDIDDMIFGEESMDGEGIPEQTIDGLLSRETFIGEMKKIESGIGRREDIAGQVAEASASIIADATKYPVTAPSSEPNIEDFIAIADTVESIFADLEENARGEKA